MNRVTSDLGPSPATSMHSLAAHPCAAQRTAAQQLLLPQSPPSASPEREEMFCSQPGTSWLVSCSSSTSLAARPARRGRAEHAQRVTWALGRLVTPTNSSAALPPSKKDPCMPPNNHCPQRSLTPLLPHQCPCQRRRQWPGPSCRHGRYDRCGAPAARGGSGPSVSASCRALVWRPQPLCSAQSLAAIIAAQLELKPDSWP